MPSSIEDKIVGLKFDNKQFEQGTESSIRSLDKLNSSLKMNGAADGIKNVSSSLSALGGNGALGAIQNGVEALNSKFSALGIAGITMLSNIANQAISTGVQLAKSLTIEPIMSGFQEYETQMNAVQTILANTASKGTNLTQVNAALDELNTYADKTIYNFTEMTRNIGTFTAAGVSLDTSTQAIKGIANLAAVSGSNAQQASTAMYQLSQAMASGTVKLMDWNSVVNAGMGGQVFQDALKETARVSGVEIDKMITDQGSFRETLQEGWLTTEILTKTLAKFTGDLNEEQLKSQGYTEEQIKDIMKLGQMASDAATKVKTFTQLKDTLKEAAQSGWSQSWRIITGDFEEAKKMFTNVSNVLGGMIGASADARNKVLQGWKDMGGRTALIDAISYAFNGVMTVVNQFKTAMNTIFPPVTAQQLVAFTEGIRHITATFAQFTQNHAPQFLAIFKNIFSVLHIGQTIIMGVVKVLGAFLKPLKSIQGDSMGVVVSITNIFGALDRLLTKSRVFDTIAKYAEKFGYTVASVMNMLTKGDFTGGGFFQEDSPFVAFFLKAHDVILAVKDVLGSLFTGDFKGNPLLMEDSPIITGVFKIRDALSNLKVILVSLFTGDFKGNNLLMEDSPIIATVFKIRAGVLGLMEAVTLLFTGDYKGNPLFEEDSPIVFNILKIRDAIGKLFGIFKPGSGSEQVDETARKFSLFGELGKLLTKFFEGLASIFPKIIAGMASFGAIVSTSMVKVVEKIKHLFSEMDFGKIFQGINIALILAIGASIVRFINNLTGAVKTGKGAWGEFTGMFKKVNETLTALQGQLKSQILINIAIAIAILAGSLLLLSLVPMDKMAPGLATITAMMGELIGTMTALDKLISSGGDQKLLAVSSAMVIMGLAILVFAAALKKIGQLDTEAIGKGLLALTGVMAQIVLMSHGLNGEAANITKTAAGMIIMGLAIKVLATAVEDLGKMDWKVLGIGIAALGAIMAEIAGFSHIMGQVDFKSSVAMIAMAVAIKMMVGTIQDIGNMDWKVLGKGLAGIGGILLEIGTFSRLLDPKGMLSASLAMVVMGYALDNISAVISKIGAMSVETLTKGLVTIGAVLVALGVFSRTSNPVQILAASAALLVMSAAINVISGALQTMGGMSWGNIAKGLTALGGSLLILVAAMLFAESGLPGAAAIMVMAVALNMLTPVLTTLGGMSWGDIAKGLVALGGALLILVGAGYLAEGAAVGLLALGGAMLLIGAGLALVGVGILAVGLGITMLAVAAATGTVAIVGMVSAIIGLIPAFILAIGQGIVLLLQLFITNAPLFFQAITVFLSGFLTAINQLIPQAVQTLVLLISTLLSAITTLVPQFIVTCVVFITGFLTAINIVAPQVIQTIVQLIINLVDAIVALNWKFINAGMQIIRDFLQGIADNISDVVTAGTNIIINLIDGIEKNFSRIADKAGEAIVSFVNSAASAVEKHSGELRTAAGRLATAIIDGMTGGLASQAGALFSKVEEIGNTAVNKLKDIFNIHSPSRVTHEIGENVMKGLENGIDRRGRYVNKSMTNVGKSALDSLKEGLSGPVGVDDAINTSPVITPVVELGKYKHGVSMMDKLMQSVNGTTHDARSAQLAMFANGSFPIAQDPVPVQAGDTNITFEQNNYSPKALSRLEIYRQTNNQLSSLKGALNNP